MTKKEFKKKMDDFHKSLVEVKTLEEILAIREPGRLFSFLVQYRKGPPLHSVHEIRQQPEIVQLVFVINAFFWSVFSSGIGQFLQEPETGDFFDQLKRHCDQLGASSASAYLAKVTAFFPNGRIPEDETERSDLVETIDFQKLDQEYAGCFDELATCLRDYIHRNLDKFAKPLSGE